MAKHRRMKAETLGGRNVSVPVEGRTFQPINEAYIKAYVAMYSERQEQMGRQRWPKGTIEKMVEACAGIERSRDLKVAIAEVAGMDVEDL